MEKSNPTISEIYILADEKARMGQMGKYEQAQMGQIGKWPWCYTTTDSGNSLELQSKSLKWCQVYMISTTNPYESNRPVTTTSHN